MKTVVPHMNLMLAVEELQHVMHQQLQTEACVTPPK
jgi:hypothetical protein